MALYRMISIVEQGYREEFLKVISEDFNSKKINEKDGYDLYYLEGRYLPKISDKKTLLLGIDGRNTTWLRQGNERLRSIFNTKIDLCVGFALGNDDYSKLKNKKAFKDCLKSISKASGEEFYPDDDADILSMRIDIELGEASQEVMASLQKLARLFEDNDASYRVAYFSGEHGHSDGELDDEGEFFGPAAYAKASWEIQVMRTETVEITVNDSEALYDGGDLSF